MRVPALFVLSAWLLIALSAHAQTFVQGRIEADTTWQASGNPYVLTGDVEVGGGATLTIEEGVRVEGMAGTRLIIGGETDGDFGTLQVLGIDGQRAGFVARVDDEPWGGIAFRDNAVDARYDVSGEFLGGSIMRHALIQEALQPIRKTGSHAFLDSVSVFGGTGFENDAISINIRSAEFQTFRARGLEVGGASGYGLRLEGGAGHVLEDCNFEGNGGGVYLLELWSRGDAPPIRFERCRFVRNGLDGGPPAGDGGGMLIATFADLYFVDCLFLSNESPQNGGGIWGSAGNLFVTRCDFIDNHAGVSGGGMDIAGLLTTIEDSTFIENTAERSAAGYLGGAGPSSTLVMRRCEFRGNRAWRGGATSLSFGPTEIEDCDFIENSSVTDSGAVRFFGDRGTIRFARNRFINNVTAEEGGAIGFIESDDHDSVIFAGNTFEGNIARFGGAVYTTNIDDDVSVFTFAEQDGLFNTFTNNTAQLGDAIYHAGPVDIDATGVCWGTSVPAAIANRIYDGRDGPGLGIVSFDPVAPDCEDCRVDLDGDGALTLFDYLAFSGLFGLGDLQADFDGDGALTIFDFLLFQTEFQAGCP